MVKFANVKVTILYLLEFFYNEKTYIMTNSCYKDVSEVLNVQMNEIFFKNSILQKNIVLNTNTNKYYNFV